MDLSQQYVHFGDGALAIPASAFPKLVAEASLPSDISKLMSNLNILMARDTTTTKQKLRLAMMDHIDHLHVTSLRALAKELGCHHSYVDRVIREDKVSNWLYKGLQTLGLMK